MTTEEHFFDALKSHRESKNIEISEICDFTKINSRYIEAIESGEFTILPVVYMRLFLREYANFIGADSEKALEDYELYTTGKVSVKETVAPSSDTDQKSTPTTDNFNNSFAEQIPPKQIIIGVSVVVGIFLLLYWAGQITNQQSSGIDSQSTQNTEQIELMSQDSVIVPADDPEEEIDKKKAQ